MRRNFLFGLMLSIFLMSFYPILAIESTSFSVTPDIITGDINLSTESYILRTLTITNKLDETISLDITSDNTHIEITQALVQITANSTSSVTLIISATEQTVINGKVKINKGTEEIEIPVIVSATAISGVTEGEALSVFPSGKTLTIVQQATTTVSLTITNVGSSPLDLSADISGGTVTKEGINKPLMIGDFSAGTIEPGGKRTLIANINAVNVEVGKYSPKLLLEYAPGKVKEILFQITVEKSVTPILENKSMSLNIYPETPEVGSMVYLTTTDKDDNIVPATVKIIHYDCLGSKIEEFNYKFPFTISTGNYSISATADNYAKITKIISLAELATKIIVSPANPTTDDTIKIRYLTENDILIDNGEIILNNTAYTGEASVKLNEGSYTITADAPGYVEASKQIEVIKVLKIIIQKTVLSPDEEQVIKFNKEVSWELRTEERTIDYGKGDKFQFKESEPGIYDIYIGDKNYGSLTVESTAPNLGFIIDYWWIIALIVGGFIIFKFAKLPKRGYKKSSLSYGTYTKSPLKEVDGVKDKDEN